MAAIHVQLLSIVGVLHRPSQYVLYVMPLAITAQAVDQKNASLVVQIFICLAKFAEIVTSPAVDALELVQKIVLSVPWPIIMSVERANHVPKINLEQVVSIHATV